MFSNLKSANLVRRACIMSILFFPSGFPPLFLPPSKIQSSPHHFSFLSCFLRSFFPFSLLHFFPSVSIILIVSVSKLLLSLAEWTITVLCKDRKWNLEHRKCGPHNVGLVPLSSQLSCSCLACPPSPYSAFFSSYLNAPDIKMLTSANSDYCAPPPPTSP